MRQLPLGKLSLLSILWFIFVIAQLLLFYLLICLIIDLNSDMVHPLRVRISNALPSASFPSRIRVGFMLTQTHVGSFHLLVL